MLHPRDTCSGTASLSPSSVSAVDGEDRLQRSLRGHGSSERALEIDGATDSTCWRRRRRSPCGLPGPRSALPLRGSVGGQPVVLKGLGIVRELRMPERIVMSAEVDQRQALRDELSAPVLEQWFARSYPARCPSARPTPSIHRPPRGAKAAAIYYALIGTCLLQGIDPRAYLVEVLGRLDEPPSRLTPHAIREAWQAANQPT